MSKFWYNLSNTYIPAESQLTPCSLTIHPTNQAFLHRGNHEKFLAKHSKKSGGMEARWIFFKRLSTPCFSMLCLDSFVLFLGTQPSITEKPPPLRSSFLRLRTPRDQKQKQTEQKQNCSYHSQAHVFTPCEPRATRFPHLHRHKEPTKTKTKLTALALRSLTANFSPPSLKKSRENYVKASFPPLVTSINHGLLCANWAAPFN